MHRSSDFGLQHALPPHAAGLTQDLELETLLMVMAGGDRFLFDTAKRALLLSLRDPDEIVYRQGVMQDCLDNPWLARELYALAGEALEAERRIWGWLRRASPERIAGVSVQRMRVLVGFLRRVRNLMNEHAPQLASPGLTRFCAMVADELDEPYLRSVDACWRNSSSSAGC